MPLNDRVLFDRPDLPQLKKDHTIVDLHFHSHYSDGLNRIPKIAKRAKKLGIGIAITDHNEILGALEMDAHDDVFSIPGIEITSACRETGKRYDMQNTKQTLHTLLIETFAGVV